MESAVDIPHFASTGVDNVHPFGEDRRPAASTTAETGPDVADASVGKIPRKPLPLKAALLGGAAAVVVAALGVFLLVPHHAAHQAPGAALRPVTTVTSTTIPAATPASRLAHVQVVRPAPLKVDNSADLNQLLAMQGSSSPKTAAEAHPAPAGHHAVSATPPTVTDVPAPKAGLPASVPATAAAAPREVGEVTPAAMADQQAAQLQAAPMTSADEVKVLQLVTKMAVLVEDQRVQIANLRGDEQALHKSVDDRLGDFDRRVSLAEASGAVRSASASADAAVASAAATSTTQAPATQAPVPFVAPQPVAALGSRHYRIQAASPGLAMLADTDSNAQVSVSPGESLAGYGKVISIAQIGTRWQIATEHGSVR